MLHRGVSHTVLAALRFRDRVRGACAWWWRRERFAPAALAFGAAYLSHLVLDWMTIDTRPPAGGQFLWPLSDAYYIAPVTIFTEIHIDGRTRAAFLESVLAWPTVVVLARELVDGHRRPSAVWHVRRSPAAPSRRRADGPRARPARGGSRLTGLLAARGVRGGARSRCSCASSTRRRRGRRVIWSRAPPTWRWSAATTPSSTRSSCCAPCEWWLGGRPAGVGQLLGAGLACAGVVGYRRAGRMLGDHLSPLIAPAEPATLVERGPYRRVRHPMYLAELAMAFGVPLLLGARWTLVVSAALRARGRAADPRRRAGACRPTPRLPGLRHPHLSPHPACLLIPLMRPPRCRSSLALLGWAAVVYVAYVASYLG